MNSIENWEVTMVSYSSISYNFLLDNLVLILIGLCSYVLISIFIIKPYVQKKAMKEIGGNIVVKSDPMLIVLPVLFAVILAAFWLVISNTNS